MRLAAANPHYGEGAEWDDNCQRAVVAYELQRRGYDVTATARDMNDRIKRSGIAAWKIDVDNLDADTGFALVSDKAQFKKTVEDAFARWGDDARAVARLEWTDGGGHFISVRKAGGKLLYEDPQRNASRLIDATLKECTEEKNVMWIMRVDNREVSDAVSDAVKNIGGKE